MAEYVILIYGLSGVGKTTLFSQFDNPHFFWTQRGGKGLKGLYGKFIEDWPHWLGLVKKWQKPNQFDIGVIDVVGELWDMCFSYMCEKNRWDVVEWGAWDEIRKEFFGSLNRFLRPAKKGAGFIMHCEYGTRKTSDDETIQDIHPLGVPGKGAERLIGMVDTVGYYHRVDDRNLLMVRGDDEIFAKSRGDRFKYTDGTPIREFDMGSTEKESYSLLVDAFGNKLAKPKRKKKKKPKRSLKGAKKKRKRKSK